jgi:hypothetical protein
MRFLTIVLALGVSIVPSYRAFALNYSGSQGNAATFETLEETRASSPVAVAQLETNNGKAFKSHPVLDGYPKGTTYVYRSANLFGGRAAARLNTNILVFTERSFSGKDAALAYLKDLDLIRIIDEAIGSVVLVTPSGSKAGLTAGSAEEGSFAGDVHDVIVRPSRRFRSGQWKHRRRLPDPTQSLPWLQWHEDD